MDKTISPKLADSNLIEKCFGKHPGISCKSECSGKDKTKPCYIAFYYVPSPKEWAEYVRDLTAAPPQ
jgi:hypothetical protein